MRFSGKHVTVVAIAAFAAGIGVTAQQNASSWPRSMSTDAVVAAPEVHKVLLENDHVRLLEITLQSGETEKPHDHRWPSAIIMDAPMGTRTNHEIQSGRKTAMEPRHENSDWTTPQVVLLPPQALHQLTNTSSYPEHFYRLEFKRMDGNRIMTMTRY